MSIADHKRIAELYARVAELEKIVKELQERLVPIQPPGRPTMSLPRG